MAGGLNFLKRGIDLFADRTKSIAESIGALFASSEKASVNEGNVLSLTPVWRAVYIISTVIANLPVNLYRYDDDGNVELAESHVLNRLISEKPHPLYTPYSFFSAMMVNVLVWGNAIAKIHRNNRGDAKALEVIPMEELEDIFLKINDVGEPYLLYKLRNNAKMLAGDDVIHIMGMSMNALNGMNPTQFHKKSLSSEAAIRDFVESFFQNGAFLSGVVEVPTVLDTDRYNRLSKTWRDAYAGSKRAGGTAVLDGGATYKKIGLSIPETGFDMVKNASIADVSRIYGVPEYMLDSKNKPTYASIEHISLDFKRYTIDGWCTQICQELTRKLVSKEGSGKYFFEYDKSGLTSGDLATMGEYYTKLFNIGVLNRNEIRAFLKKNNVEGGDEYYVQGNNMVRVKDIDALVAIKMQKGGTPTAQPDVQSIKE